MARKCLRCGKSFTSKNKARRICTRCHGIKGPVPSTTSKDTRNKLKEALKRRGKAGEHWKDTGFRFDN